MSSKYLQNDRVETFELSTSISGCKMPIDTFLVNIVGTHIAPSLLSVLNHTKSQSNMDFHGVKYPNLRTSAGSKNNAMLLFIRAF